MTRRRILLLYALPAVLLAAGTLPFLLDPELDLLISRKFYLAGANLWTFAAAQPWIILYKFGTIPALLTAILSFSILVLGMGRPRLAPWRRLTAYLVLVLLIGPGIVASILLKDNWGRPRPREVVEFGGHHPFEPLLTIDPASPGKSFVSGHATMGFYFFALALLAFAAGRRKTGLAVLLGALVFGTLIGIARIAQGGHFASDVLWAAGVVWFTTAGLYPVLRLHRGILSHPAKPARALLRPWVSTLLLAALLLVVAIVCLAWPYDRIRKSTLLHHAVEHLPDTVILNLDLEGALELVPGDDLVLVTESRGAGFPKSSLANNCVFIDDGAEVTHEREGWFRVLHAHTKVTLPPNRVYHITLGKRVTSLHVPSEKRDQASFAHVRLTTPLRTTIEHLPGRLVAEDNFGRKTRAFSF